MPRTRLTPVIKATRISQTEARTVWKVEWVYPSMSGKWGKSYRAITYPKSHLIALETAATRRTVAAGVATRIMPQVRAALIAAGAPLREDAHDALSSPEPQGNRSTRL